VWESTVDGRALTFHLAGINNQNFIMRDEETGSWWQQVTGEAILGPLKGRKLKPVLHDEISFKTWKHEEAGGRVLRPDERVAASGEYAPADWEERMKRVPVTTGFAADKRLEPRTLVVGLNVGGSTKAYPLSALQKQSPVQDRLGGIPVLLIVGEDQKSVRAYESSIEDSGGKRTLELFAKPGTSPLIFVDAQTGSEWDFSGTAISGPLTGKQLPKLSLLEDYWFDWHSYNPQTAVYAIGESK
jgi:hypothetical protein